MMSARDYEATAIESAFDIRAGVELEGFFGDELADEASFDDCMPHQGVRVQQVTFFLQNKAAISADVLG